MTRPLPRPPGRQRPSPSPRMPPVFGLGVPRQIRPLHRAIRRCADLSHPGPSLTAKQAGACENYNFPQALSHRAKAQKAESGTL